MSTRLAILEITARHKLDTATLLSLRRIARIGQQPASLTFWLRRGLGYVAALFAGLGLVFFIAANWSYLGRPGQFLLLEACVAATAIGAALLPQVRQPFALLGLLSVGSLFAYFGQTYQTGADAWQLFALWSLLGLPLALAARSDVVWTAWIIIGMTGVGAWDHAHSGSWIPSRYDHDTHAVAAMIAIGLAISMCGPLRRYTGARDWAFNVAVLFAASMTATVGALDLFKSGSLYYLISLLLFAFAAALLCLPSVFDIRALSIVALGLNFLLVGGIAEQTLSGVGDFLVALFIIGLTAAGLLSVTVWAILSLTRQYRKKGGANE